MPALSDDVCEEVRHDQLQGHRGYGRAGANRTFVVRRSM
jgi:hypothetical protein